jgi:penicillin-binding protein 1A
VEPTLVDRIQDRYGETIYRHDQRVCTDCTDLNLPPGDAPNIESHRTRIMNAVTAYELTSMLEGVVQRGTAARAIDLSVPIAGKTGTTNEAKDAWFVGFSPDLVVAVFVGYDQPRPMGKRATGASVALPIWIDVMRDALKDKPATPFRTPPGLSLVRVDATTGRLAQGGRNVIAEAFIPGTEPGRDRSTVEESTDKDPFAVPKGMGQATSPSSGGLY